MPQLGTVMVDVAYGGMFYVIADAEALGFRLTPDEGRDITRVTEMIKAAAAEQLPVVHPEQPGVRRHHHRAAVRAGPRRAELVAERGDGLDRRRSTGTGRRPGPGVIDRSPCGTGTCAKMAVAPRARAGSGSARTSATRGSSGTVFTGRLVEETRVGDRDRGRARRSPGTAWITGFASYVVDPTDPFPEGFTVGDIW